MALKEAQSPLWACLCLSDLKAHAPCCIYQTGLSSFLCAWVHAKWLKSCPTLCDPMNCSPPGSCVNGILQARILEWVAMPSPRESSQPKDPTGPSWIASGFWATWVAPAFQGQKWTQINLNRKWFIGLRVRKRRLRLRRLAVEMMWSSLSLLLSAGMLFPSLLW